MATLQHVSRRKFCFLKSVLFYIKWNSGDWFLQKRRFPIPTDIVHFSPPSSLLSTGRLEGEEIVVGRYESPIRGRSYASTIRFNDDKGIASPSEADGWKEGRAQRADFLVQRRQVIQIRFPTVFETQIIKRPMCITKLFVTRHNL